MIILDTNIFIEVFKGNSEVVRAVQSVGTKNIALSAVTVMELYYGAINRLELQRIKKHLEMFTIAHVSISISETATKLTERYAKSHNLQIPDALIAATALDTQSELMTLNIKDFRFIPGLSLVPAIQAD